MRNRREGFLERMKISISITGLTNAFSGNVASPAPITLNPDTMIFHIC